MNKLTAEKCRQQIEEFQHLIDSESISTKAERHLQAYRIALPVLERQGSDGDTFIVMRNPGKVPDIKRPVGDVADYLVQLYQHNPGAVCDVVTYRFSGVSGQWVQDGRELLAMSGVVLEQQEKGDDGWLEWGGGDCPIPDRTPVEVKFRNGKTNSNHNAEVWGWQSSPELPMDHDIIAYRVIK